MAENNELGARTRTFFTDELILQSLSIISFSALLMTTVGIYFLRNVLHYSAATNKKIERGGTYVLGLIWTLLLISTAIQLRITVAERRGETLRRSKKILEQ